MRKDEKKTYQPSRRLSEESKPHKENSLVNDMFNSSLWQSNKYSESRVQQATERRQSINTTSPQTPYSRFADTNESGAFLRQTNLPIDDSRKLRVEK